MSSLVIVDGPAVGTTYSLQDMVLIGRDPRCQVVLNHREVSGHHARLLRAGGGYLLEDLQSRNHTYVNGKRITRERLRDGDLVRLGRTTFRYEESHGAERSSGPDMATVTVELDATKDILSLGTSTPKESHINKRLKLLIDVSQALGEVQGMKTTLDKIGNLLLEVFPQAASATILLAQGGQLIPMTAVTREGVNQDVGYSETIARKALTERRSFLSVDALSDARFSNARSVVDLRLRSVMCAPILFRADVLGVVEIDTLSSPRMFTEDDLNLFTAVANQVAASVANARLYDDLQALAFNHVSSLMTALESRPVSGVGHSEGVARVAMPLGRRLELDGPDLEELRLLSLLHDIGTLAIPEAILEKAGPLTEAEWTIVRTHPLKSVEILEPVRQFQRLLPAIRAHHERFDGQGYPDGLRGEEIPLAARILAVADAFYAMVSSRPYRNAMEPEEALAEIQELSGSAYDPKVVAPMERIVRSWRRTRDRRRGVKRS